MAKSKRAQRLEVLAAQIRAYTLYAPETKVDLGRAGVSC